MKRIFKAAIYISIVTLAVSGCKTSEKNEADSIDSKKAKALSTPEQYINSDNDYASIVIGGDVMLDWGIKDFVEKRGKEYSLYKLRSMLKSYDYRFCNLECPISEKGVPDLNKKYIFLAKPDDIKILKYVGINGVTLANNHSNDFGKTALIDTITHLNLNGISHTGAGVNRETAHLPVLIRIRDISFAIFGYTNLVHSRAFASSRRPGVANASFSLIKRDIKRYRGYVDYIIVTLHWGVEYADYPTKNQVRMAHAIINSGADVIFGHHSHIFQGIEIYKGKPIFYSLGNFIFGSINEDIRNNIIVAIRFKKRGIHSFTVIPINCNKGRVKDFRYAVLDSHDATQLFSHLFSVSRSLKSDFSDSAVQDKSLLRYYFLNDDLLKDEMDEEI